MVVQSKNEMDGVFDEEFRKRFEDDVAQVGKLFGDLNGIIPFESFFKSHMIVVKHIN